MSELGETPSPTETARINLVYGRDLFIQLFQDDGPLANLGYSEKQKMPTRRALSVLESEGKYIYKPKPHVIFSDNTTEPIPHAFLTTLGNGGYKVVAGSNFLVTHPTDKELLTTVAPLTDLRSEEDPINILAVIDLLPRDQDYSDMETLIKHLYENAWMNRWHERNPAVQKPNPLNILTSRLSTSNAVFRAGWIDENTKLELVVETDIYSKVKNYRKGDKIQEVWRKLPSIESTEDLRVWIPFGKKPNPSRQNIERVLQGKDAKSFSFGRNLGFEGNKS